MAKIKNNKRYIILDTNIISYFSKIECKEKILEVLRYAVSLGYGLAISDITYFELFNEIPVKKEQEMVSVLANISRIYVKKKILVAAAHLGSFYKEHNLPPEQFSPGDKIIASSAILTNSIIYTANARDFPTPFFKEIERKMIDYQNKEYPVCLPTYFLEPQLDYINKYHEKRIEPYVLVAPKAITKETETQTP